MNTFLGAISGRPKTKVLTKYKKKKNEQLVMIENMTDEPYVVYAVYVDGEYDRRIKVKK
jgi:hypothetical protein